MIINKIQKFYTPSKQSIWQFIGEFYKKLESKNHIFLKTFESGFQEIKVWFTDQRSQQLEIEDKTNLTLIIRQYSSYKNTLFN